MSITEQHELKLDDQHKSKSVVDMERAMENKPFHGAWHLSILFVQLYYENKTSDIVHVGRALYSGMAACNEK